jgi:hypothetical protein
MNQDFSLQIAVLSGVPPINWAAGSLKLSYRSGTPSGELKLDQYSESFLLSGTLTSDIMNGIRLIVKGSNSLASIEIYGCQSTDDLTNRSYLGGIVNILDYEVQEWTPFILTGAGE